MKKTHTHDGKHHHSDHDEHGHEHGEKPHILSLLLSAVVTSAVFSLTVGTLI